MKIDCPNFRLFIDNIQIGNYSTRADLYNTLTALNLGSREIWRESGLNKDWCERNDIERLYDDCFVYSK